MTGGVRDLLARIAPGRRRWHRFLQDLPLDPDVLPRPLPAPGASDFILCGCPRTGTTLLAAALFQPPEAVVVMEPWDGMRMAPAELFASLRAEIQQTGELRRGRLDLRALRERGATAWCPEGASPAPVPSREGFALGVKWPGYWRYLEHLPSTKFVVTVRHPAEVVASFRNAGGRLASGLQYDTRFNRDLNRTLLAATDDVSLRRILLFDYVHERLLPHLGRSNVFVVRYERWYADPKGLMTDIGEFLDSDVGSPPVTLQPARSKPDLSPGELGMLRAHCRTASPLGYEP